ncbi:IS1182 family transposase [Sinorhizobium americanum]|uniref:Transposase IS4 family protein n=2 Tax=Sinorhizobium americanum TaxID=194963 RepID=A0A1L3LKP6_9HYPH|nr:IS1182 family transposase [Sinorhizobium americanum]APG90626.1 transposase IS4 family protein [Sinorhizobium americanum]APG94043.1 transposase IS4 family protein [Sinorhizobium americanum]APG95341.1 transposase IS4 family protein [Sinorhizobium americanum]
MKRFIEGEDRRQTTLLPDTLEDYVTQDNPVRVIDVFIDELDLEVLGFAGTVPEATGRPSYHPATLLKIYLYGYLNRIQSSRRLERESQRNIELMWLTGRLMPDFKTIADFRRDNGAAIRAACAQFVVLCRQLNLFTRAVVAIDGSKFKAVNNRDKNFTVAKVVKRIEQVEASIARYLTDLDRADREDGDIAGAKTVRLKEKIEGLRRQMQSLREIGKQVEAAPDKQVSLTDPDARSMATSGKGTGIVGYNVQIAVDAEHHLIVAHEVTNLGSDRAQLSAMAEKARDATGCEEVTVLADRGYYNGDEVLACEGTGILPIIPKTRTSGNAKRGLFTVADFIYDAETDRYTCPAGEHLTRGKVRSDRRDNIDQYRNLTACLTCALKSRCTPDKIKRLKRWQHESVLDKMQARLDRMLEAMTIRRQTVEHPFGTLKAWMGSTHFLTRTLDQVKTEMSLQVLAYNMKRMINIFGVKPLMEAIAA